MPFDQTPITEVFIDPEPSLRVLFVSWDSSAPEGTWFQVYLDRKLAYYGTQRYTELPWPDGPVTIDVGTVDPGEGADDLSATLPAPAATGPYVELTWFGGRYLDPHHLGDVAGFRVYGESSPGGGIAYGNPLADIPLSLGPDRLDGFGRGGFGRGGFGHARTRYRWRGGPYASGTWHFGVKAYDLAGNESTVATASVVISGPPGPPAPFADGLRLHYTIDPATHVPTLSWNPP